LITRLKTVAGSSSVKDPITPAQAALKVCMTTGLSRKEVEKAGITIRHAITKVMTRRR